MRLPDIFYSKLKEPNRSCMEAVRHVILQYDSRVTETVKYGMPSFCYQQKMLCYLWINKNTKFPYIGIVDGKLIDLPWLDAGDRARMKIFPIDPYEDIEVKKIRQTLKLAIAIAEKK